MIGDPTEQENLAAIADKVVGLCHRLVSIDGGKVTPHPNIRHSPFTKQIILDAEIDWRRVMDASDVQRAKFQRSATEMANARAALAVDAFRRMGKPNLPPDYEKWARYPKWTTEQAAALLLDHEPGITAWTGLAKWKAEKFDRLVEIITLGKASPDLSLHVSSAPISYLLWAGRNRLPVSDALTNAVLDFSAWHVPGTGGNDGWVGGLKPSQEAQEAVPAAETNKIVQIFANGQIVQNVEREALLRIIRGFMKLYNGMEVDINDVSADEMFKHLQYKWVGTRIGKRTVIKHLLAAIEIGD